MKYIFTLIMAFLLNFLNAQTGSTGSVTIFSEDGDKFTLILNGEVINDTPQSNLRVEDLNQPFYSAKVKFENQMLVDISTNNLMVTDYDNVYSDVTYKIKRDKNNKTKMKMNYFSSVPVNPRFIPASNVQVVHYGRPREVVVVQNQTPVRGSTTQTTTTTTTGNGNVNSVGVGINIGGINMGVSINDNMGAGSITQTTTTTTSSNVNHSNHQNNGNSNNFEESSRGCGRRSCMTQRDFSSALQTIQKITFEETALKTAKQVITVNCLNVDQIIQIANLFKFEDNKLEFAKYAYEFCIEPRNYFKLNGIFTFDSNAEELSQYVQNRQ